MALLQNCPVLETSYTVKTEESVAKYTFVKQDKENEDHILTAGGQDQVLGVAQESGIPEDVIRVMILGIAIVRAAEEIPLGAKVCPGLEGRARLSPGVRTGFLLLDER